MVSAHCCVIRRSPLGIRPGTSSRGRRSTSRSLLAALRGLRSLPRKRPLSEVPGRTRQRTIVTLALLLATANCSDDPTGIERAKSRLDQNRQKWVNQAIADYNIRMNVSVAGAPFTIPSDVVVQVRNGAIVTAVDPDTDALVFEALRRPDLYPDVEGLFDIVERSIDEADELRVAYDEEFGFPREILSDPDRGSVDGEYEALIVEFTPTDEPVQPLQERVATRREQWEATGIEDYAYSLARVAPGLGPGLGFENVRVTVRDGAVASRTVIETGLQLDPAFDEFYPPIDAIFDAIDAAILANVHRVAVEFELQLGYPTHAFIDTSASVSDDHEEYIASDLAEQ